MLMMMGDDHEDKDDDNAPRCTNFPASQAAAHETATRKLMALKTLESSMARIPLPQPPICVY